MYILDFWYASTIDVLSTGGPDWCEEQRYVSIRLLSDIGTIISGHHVRSSKLPWCWNMGTLKYRQNDHWSL